MTAPNEELFLPNPEWWPPKSMFLDKIKNEPVPNRGLLRPTNETKDIIGAQPRILIGAYAKPDLHGVDDIAGSHSMKLHGKFSNKPDFFDPKDICHDEEHKRPSTQTLKTRRIINPLMPIYKLPSYTYHPLPEPKFQRDNMLWKDITHCQTQQEEVVSNFKLRGRPQAKTQLTPRNRISMKPRNSLQVNDITHPNWRSGRSTNPLSPSYHVHCMDYGTIDKNEPKKLSRKYIRNSISTYDIVGAQANTKRKTKRML